MSLTRREFLQMLGAASFSGFSLQTHASPDQLSAPYDIERFGNVSLLHYTDCHAQLNPVYFREPGINLGVAGMKNQLPHLTGNSLLKHYKLPPNSLNSHAFSCINFNESAKIYGKTGGFAHLKTLADQIREQRPGSLLLDGGDTWQGSWTSLKTNAQDMIDAQILLGVDVMTAHWEMTFGMERVMEVIAKDFKNHIDFVAQNVMTTDFEEPVFEPYTLKEINKIPVAIIGQAFPYTPIANPRHLVEDWSFGIRDQRMQEMVDEARDKGAQLVILLSHNGMDVDLKMASRVRGIDAIMGGHTHDGVYQPIIVNNPAGQTLVTNAGSNGKFLGVLDLEVKNGTIRNYRYHLLPVFANLLPAHAGMQTHIDTIRRPYLQKLNEPLASCDTTLYRRGNFNGSFDQLICDALIQEMDAPIAFSPGFRWGTSLLPGETINFEQVANQTAITYPTVTRNEIRGADIKTILEDVADNLFNPDPYYQQGGDMVRTGGLSFTIDPTESIGKRISDLNINGKAIDAEKRYPVAGWASVQENIPDNPPIWDIVARYLRDKKHIETIEINEPRIKNIMHNQGYSHCN